MSNPIDREIQSHAANPLGLDGIEFIEYSTSRPQALGQALEMMGFRPVARHRSREVLLYRQGTMNVVINAHGSARGGPPGAGGDTPAASDSPTIAAFAFRVRDAAAAYARALARGAWGVPTQVEVMELNIPAIHGVGGSRIYFVDRYQEFSIWSVDFVPIPGADPHPPAVAGLHWFGIVQYIDADRNDDWSEFYHRLFGFNEIPGDKRFGIMPNGTILQSPCKRFYLQLVEPLPDLVEVECAEMLQRVGLGTPDVPAAVDALRARGVEFFEGGKVHSNEHGALTTRWMGSLMFELVHDDPAAPRPAAAPMREGPGEGEGGDAR